MHIIATTAASLLCGEAQSHFFGFAFCLNFVEECFAFGGKHLVVLIMVELC
jgi:hypothetical protein